MGEWDMAVGELIATLTSEFRKKSRSRKTSAQAMALNLLVLPALAAVRPL